MPALALRLSDRQLKAVKAKDKDYVLSDGDGLQLRVRSNGSMLWNFSTIWAGKRASTHCLITHS